MKKKYQQFRCSQMMLPEHRQKLEEQKEARRQNDLSPPLIDEQEREQWDLLLRTSLETGRKLTITYLTSSGYRETAGEVKKVSRSPACLYLETTEGAMVIPCPKIVSINLL